MNKPTLSSPPTVEELKAFNDWLSLQKEMAAAPRLAAGAYAAGGRKSRERRNHAPQTMRPAPIRVSCKAGGAPSKPEQIIVASVVDPGKE